MEISFVTIFSRPSKDVLWWHDYADKTYPDYVKYVQTEFRDTKKLIVEFTEIDDNTIVRSVTFSTPEAEEKWFSDELVQKMSEVRESYNSENHIVELN